MREIDKNEFNRLYNGSWYTIVGAGGDLEEWEKGIQDLLDSKDIGKVKEWVTYKGKDMNEWARLSKENAYPEDLTFISFPLDGLDLGKLAIFKVQMQDRWFDDIVDNNARREGFHPIKSGLNEDTKSERLKNFINTYNKANINAIIEESTTICRMFDSIARKNGLVYNKDFVCPPFKENQIIKLSDKKVVFQPEEESLNEDTIKQNGKWVNKGKEGTHGKFKTKKEADAQRKAMFAQGYKVEAVEKSYASKLSRKELVEIIWEVLDECIEYSIADAFYMDTHLDPNFDSLRDVSTEELRWIVDELNKKGYLDQQFYDDQAAGIDWEPNKYIVREAVDSMGRNRPDTYKKREPKKKNLSYQIYDDLERLGYNVFASKDTYGYEISKKYEKNLDKAKDLLNNLNVPYKVKEIRGRFYLTVFLKPEQEEQEKKSYSKHDKSLDEDLNNESSFFTIYAVDTGKDNNGNLSSAIHSYAVIVEADTEEEAREIYFTYADPKRFEIVSINPTTEEEKEKKINIVYKNTLNLKEDLNQNTFDESALVTLLNDLINDENDAINGYESAIASLASINKNDYEDVFKDIIKEEQNHIGQLQKILDDIKPGTINELEKGQDEASEQISENEVE